MKHSHDILQLAGMIVALTYRDMMQFTEAVNDGSYSASKRPEKLLEWAQGVIDDAAPREVRAEFSDSDRPGGSPPVII